MSTEITWQDCVQACDDLIGTLKEKLREEPEHGQFWQERMAVIMAKRQECQILAKQEEDAQFKKTLLNICDNVIRKNREDGII